MGGVVEVVVADDVANSSSGYGIWLCCGRCSWWLLLDGTLMVGLLLSGLRPSNT